MMMMIDIKGININHDIDNDDDSDTYNLYHYRCRHLQHRSRQETKLEKVRRRGFWSVGFLAPSKHTPRPTTRRAGKMMMMMIEIMI